MRLPDSINLLVTRQCNKNCGFCINKHLLSDTHMSLTDFEDALHFLKSQGCKKIRLVGGEPFNYPDLLDAIMLADCKGIQVDIISNGLMDEKALEKVAPYANLISLGYPNNEKELNVIKQRQQFIKGSGVSSYLYLVVDSLKFDLQKTVSTILDIMPEVVSLKIAHPNITKTNAYIANPMNIFFGKKLFVLIKELTDKGIKLFNSCFIPLCIFDEFEYAYIKDNTGLLAHSGCSRPSINSIILDYNLDVYVCPDTIKPVCNLRDYDEDKINSVIYDNHLYKVNFRCINCSARKNNICRPCAAY